MVEWSSQGFGMLRKYLPGNRRLHVWTKAAFVPNATLLHTHPWDFTSTVFRGIIYNFRYKRVDGAATHDEYKLKCGEDACVVSSPVPVRLEQYWSETIFEGQSYSQKYDEIHMSVAEEGTVTVITRKLMAEADYAQTFCDIGKQFVSAAPRDATVEEISIAEKYTKGLSL